MKRWLTALGILVALGGAGCKSLDAFDAGALVDGPARAAPGTAERRLLVMVAEQPVTHYRPGVGAGGGYGAAAGGSQIRTARALAQAYGFTIVDQWPMPSLGVRCFVGEVPAGRVPAELVERLALDPRVESAQSLQVFRVLARDEAAGSPSAAPGRSGLDAVHRTATGKGVAVAQIDTGVDVMHPALRARITETRNFVGGTRFGPEFHGTAVAGVIVAQTDGDIGGIAPGASLLTLKACWPSSEAAGAAVCDSFTLAKALQYAILRNVRIINLSLGGPRDRLLERLLDKGLERGITILGAVDPEAPADTFPAAHPGVIAVATRWAPDAPAGVVLMPGNDVLTTVPNGRWGLVSGSSFATAHVSGVAALLLECSPRLGPGEMAILLRASARRASADGASAVLDVCVTLGRAAPAVPCTCCCTLAGPHGGEASARRPS